MSILSWVVLLLGAYLIWTWARGYDVVDARGHVEHLRGPAWRLYAGLPMVGWSFLGRFVVLLCMPAGRDDPREARAEGDAVTAPDGAVLHMETFGLGTGPTLVLTHGWGLNSTSWWYARQALGSRFRLVTWDLPGLGRSKSAPDGRFTIDRFAQALGAVVESAGPGPVVLVGHSIGGMTTQTFWRACPAPLKARVAGLVLIDTTYLDPIRTMWLSSLWRALRWPVIEPVLWLTVALSPLAWLSSWQGYLSGSNQLATRLTGFGRHATRGQVDFATRLSCKGSPGVQAKGDLAMFRWDASEVASSISVPVLLLVGSKDIVTLPAASRAIAAAAPNATLVEVPGAGHMGFLERAEAYNDEIARFASRVLAA